MEIQGVPAENTGTTQGPPFSVLLPWSSKRIAAFRQGGKGTYLLVVGCHVNPLVNHRPLHDIAGRHLAEVTLSGVRVVLKR